MGGKRSHLGASAARTGAAVCLVFLLAGCGAAEKVTGKIASDPETEARNASPQDPLARPMQVAWTSARARRCGFIFEPGQLRANYLAAESQSGKTQEEMAKIQKAYDYTYESVFSSIKEDARYCSKERVAAIRRDLNRYLTGDYTPSARMGR
ncbi:MAG TPA: hypothetical protein VNJ31_05015 [Methyloceanibacter sp.]|nr:hypothetical protein [Methyloceanibacter sp.]